MSSGSQHENQIQPNYDERSTIVPSVRLSLRKYTPDVSQYHNINPSAGV